MVKPGGRVMFLLRAQEGDRWVSAMRLRAALPAVLAEVRRSLQAMLRSLQAFSLSPYSPTRFRRLITPPPTPSPQDSLKAASASAKVYKIH